MTPTPSKPEQRKPPKSLACLARHSREQGESQLRVVVDEYKGHKFLSVVIWQKTGKGGFSPTQKAITVRAVEMMDFLAAVQQAEHEMSDAVERATMREIDRCNSGRRSA